MRLVWEDERLKVLSSIFDTWRRARPGAVHRSDGRWEQILRDREFDRDGASTLFFAAHEDENGTPDGYVSYRIKRDSDEDDRPLILNELIAVDAEVEAALWQYVFEANDKGIALGNEPGFRHGPRGFFE